MNLAILAYIGQKGRHGADKPKMRTSSGNPPVRAAPSSAASIAGGRQLTANRGDAGKGQPHSVVSTSGSAPFETKCLRLKAAPQKQECQKCGNVDIRMMTDTDGILSCDICGAKMPDMNRIFQHVFKTQRKTFDTLVGVNYTDKADID